MPIKILDIFSVFMVLFAVIDITGAIPYILELKRKSGRYRCRQGNLGGLCHSSSFSVYRGTISESFRG